MLKIRLQRVGRKHEPTFRVVLTDSKNSTKSGKYLEVLGSFDPRKTTEVFQGEKIKEWMGKGAKLSPTMHNLLVTHKIIEGKKINVLPKKSPIKKPAENSEVNAGGQETAPAEAPAVEAAPEFVPAEKAPEAAVADSSAVETLAEAPAPAEEVKSEETPTA